MGGRVYLLCLTCSNIFAIKGKSNKRMSENTSLETECYSLFDKLMICVPKRHHSVLHGALPEATREMEITIAKRVKHTSVA